MYNRVCALGWVMRGRDVKCAPGVDREGCVVPKLGNDCV